jgi:AraC-like DNA-binding protein
VPTIAVLIVDRAVRERIDPVLSRFGVVWFCDRAVEVWQAIATGDVRAVVLTARDADRRSMMQLAADLTQRFPSMAVLMLVAADDESTSQDREPLALLADVVVVDANEPQTLASVARRTIGSSRVQSAGGTLLDAIARLEQQWEPLISVYLRTIVLYARWPLSVRQSMQMIDPTKRRTLDQHLRVAHLPTAEQLIGWVLALHALWLWDLPGSTLERAARALGFNDASALRSLIVNRTGVSPTEVRRRGGFTYLFDRFMALLRGDWSRETATRGASSRTKQAESHD